MWTDATTVQWLAGLGIGPGGDPDLEVLDVGDPAYIPEAPDRIGLVFGSGGPGPALEGVLERPAFQFRLRWDQNDPNGAQRAALVAHHRIVHAPTGVWVDGMWLVQVEMTGGRPARLTGGGRDGDRATYVSNYVLTVGELAHEEMISYG